MTEFSPPSWVGAPTHRSYHYMHVLVNKMFLASINFSDFPCSLVGSSERADHHLNADGIAPLHLALMHRRTGGVFVQQVFSDQAFPAVRVNGAPVGEGSPKRVYSGTRVQLSDTVLFLYQVAQRPLTSEESAAFVRRTLPEGPRPSSILRPRKAHAPRPDPVAANGGASSAAHSASPGNGSNGTGNGTSSPAKRRRTRRVSWRDSLHDVRHFQEGDAAVVVATRATPAGGAPSDSPAHGSGADGAGQSGDAAVPAAAAAASCTAELGSPASPGLYGTSQYEGQDGEEDVLEAFLASLEPERASASAGTGMGRGGETEPSSQPGAASGPATDASGGAATATCTAASAAVVRTSSTRLADDEVWYCDECDASIEPTDTRYDCRTCSAEFCLCQRCGRAASHTHMLRRSTGSVHWRWEAGSRGSPGIGN